MKQIKNTFNAGELSEYLSGRTDLSKYYNGCSRLVNATVLPHGGAVKRSGTKFIAKAKGRARLIPFVFSSDDSLILELGDQYIRFYKDGDRVMEDAITITLITASQANEEFLVTTETAHGYSNGDTVRFYDTVAELGLNYDEYGEHTIKTSVDWPKTGYSWQLSGSGTNEYYLKVDTGYPKATEPESLLENGSALTKNEGGVGSLAAGEWDYGDNDSLGYNTIYVRATDSLAPADRMTSSFGTTKFTIDLTLSADDFEHAGGTVQRVYEITSPYSEDDIFGLHYVQSGDVIRITHNDYAPRKLSRLSDDNWTLEEIVFDGIPLIEENTDDSKVLLFEEGTPTYEGLYIPEGTTGTLTAYVRLALTSGGRKWVETSTSNVYKLVKSDGNNYVFSSKPDKIFENGIEMTENGSGYTALSSGEWYYDAANDLLYIRLSDDGDPNSHSSTYLCALTEDSDSFAPFVTENDAHVGSKWQLTKDRTFDNTVSLTSTGTSKAIYVEGDLSLDASGFGSQMTVTLQRKSVIGEWADYRTFTGAVSYTTTEKDGAYYRFVIEGTTTSDTYVNMTAKNQVSHGQVEITALISSTKANATVIKPVLISVTNNITIKSLSRATNNPVKVEVNAASDITNLNDGDYVLLEGITSSEYTFLNYDDTMFIKL